MEQVRDFVSGAISILQWAFQNVCQEKACALKLGVHRLGRLSLGRDPRGAKQVPRFTVEPSARRIQKLRVLPRGNAAKQERVDVHRPIPRGPFQPPQPSCNMLGRRPLAASITPQVTGIRYRHGSTQVSSRIHFTTIAGMYSILFKPA